MNENSTGLKTFPSNGEENIGTINIKELPFLGKLILPFESNTSLYMAPCPNNGANPHPEQVRWPVGAIQNLGNFDCGDPGPMVTVEVFKTGVTGPAGNPASVNCVVYLGLNTWNCVPPQVIPMIRTGDNGLFDVFSVNLNNLPPGNHQLTCACTTNPAFIPFTDPAGANYAYGNWVGDYDPIDCATLASPFTNHTLTIAPTAPNDICTDVDDIVVGTNTSLTNVCSADGRVWYRYTVPNNGLFHKVDIDVQQGGGTLPNPQLFTVHANVCGSANISGSLPQCFAPGTELLIEAGTSLNTCSSNVGTFEIVVTLVTPVTGDICTDAQQLNNFGGNNELGCGESGSFTGNINACPDPEETCFGATTNGVWYRFTVDDKLPTFTITGGTYELFEGNNCGALTSLGCTITDEPTDPATTYYLLVGPAGTVTVTADFSEPSNDECSASLLLTTAGLNNQDNFCADDETISGCTTADDNVVWYNFVMPANHENATVQVTGTGGNPIIAPAIEVYSGTCGSLMSEGSDCAGNLDLTCLTPGQTYYIAVGSALLNAGVFDIDLSTSDNGVANDVCANADNITNTITCEYFDVTTTTTDACPESFSLACLGGNYNTDATVWMEFTVPAGVTSMNIRNVTPAAAFLSIFSSCTPGAPITNGGCINGAGPTTDINVTAGSTYFIAIAIDGSEGVVDFEIKYNDRPDNDDCVNAENTLTGTQSNLCATQDVLNANCANTLDDASVWFEYTFPAVTTQDAFTVTVTPTGSPAINTPLVAIYEGCNASDVVTDDDGNDCNATATLRCPVPGTTYLIMVSSEFGDEGDFTIAVTTSDNGVSNETCAEADNITNTVTCEYFDVTTTTTDACPESFSIACLGGNYNTDATVWMEFTVPTGVTSMNIRNVTPAGAFLSIFSSCTPGAPITNGGCINGAGPTTDINVTAGSTYFIAIAINGAEGTVDFEIKYNDRPANDACLNAENTLTGTHTNLCATQDVLNANCANTLDDASVWFEYTFPAVTTQDAFTVTATPTGSPAINSPLVAIYEGCNAGDVVTDDDGNNCNGTATLRCPVPGTTYLIMVSSEFGDEGDFTIAVTTSDNGVPNETCAQASALTLDNDLCETPPNNFPGEENTDACPESATLNFGGCTFDDGPGVWYTFTTDPNAELLDIEVTGLNVDIGLFSSCAGASVAGGCGTGGVINDVVVNGNTQYWLLVVGDNGAEGTFTINITEKANPPDNDDCNNADQVNIGVTNNLTNSCATDDFTPCTPVAQNDASVWYYYDFAGPGNEIVFTITGTGGSPINNPSIVVYDDCTAGSDMDDADGTDCDETFTLECPVPGTRYYIYVSSTSNNAGGFSLEVDVNNTAPANDNCADALLIPNNPVCEFISVTTSTTNNACPEVFSVAGCALDYMDDAVVWYEFTTPAGTTSIEIENISGTAVLSVLEDCPTGNPANILTDGDCLSGTGTNGTPIAVIQNTTYYIAIGIPNNTGNVDFDIKYNLELLNDDPCGGTFTATVVNNNTALPNQDNTCATEDDEMCMDPDIDKTLWYEFTITAPNNNVTITVTGTGPNAIVDPSIAIYDDIGAGTPNVPCTDNPKNEDCDGDGMVTFNCLNPGTYLVQIGSVTADAGIFSINITQGQNTAVANDQCTDADDIVIDELCVPLDFSTTNIDACPEDLPAGSFSLPCDFNNEETSWYTFTAPGAPGDLPTMDFTFTSYTGSGTPFMGVFQNGADCTNLTAVSTTCRDGLNETFGNIGPFTPGNQYLIAISSYGDTGGDFDFTVKFNLGPDNDDPCSPNISTNFVVPTNGVRVDGTTLCAGGDPFFPDCPQADQSNVVFFEITIPDGVRAINIRIDSRNTNGTPIPAGSTVVAGLWETACNNTTYLEAACLDLGEEYQFACYEPGTYMIQVSTSSANEGDFSILATEVPYDANCAFAEDHDICTDAQLIESGGVYCEPISIQSCNVSACPEPFTFTADCPFSTMPVVWYTFTVDAGISTIDLTGLTSDAGNLFMALFEDNGCQNPPTAVSNCITGNTTGIAVNEGQTYYLAVGTNSPTMGGSDFRFNIQFNLLPENDDPDPTSPRPPYDLSGYGSHTGSTCCAIGFADDPNQDIANIQCGGASHDNAVWYTYTIVDEKALEITVDAAGTNPISGNTTVEVILGTAAAPGGALVSDDSYHCGALSATIKFGCLNPGDVIWIKVASRDADCGDFTISVMEPRGCEFADTCEEITGAQTMETAPTDLNCGNFVITSIPGCLDLACPEETLADCGIDQNPTVWFQINVDQFAIQLFTFVTTSGNWQPVWTVYSGTCDNLTLVPGGTINEPTPCSNGDSNPDAHNVGIPLDANGEPIQTLFVAISGEGVIDDPNFTLSAYTQAACVSCIGNDACLPETTFEVTERSSDRPLDDLQFCQAEDVRVCLEFYYDPSETGVDWFHGLLPNFGRGWDMDLFDPSSVTVSPGGAVYLGPTDGACAPTITETMPLLCSYVDDLGILRLCNIKCGSCPCNPPLAQGSALPFGWFWNSNGGAGCQNTCNPSTRYGVPGSQSGLTVNICMNLRTRVFDNNDDCLENKDLRISFVTTSDGVSGCWNDPIAECKLDVAQVGPPWELDCTPPVLVDYEDVEICDNGTLDSDFSTSDGSATPINIEPIPNSNVTGMNPYNFPNGSGTVTDMLDNITTDVQVAEYIVWAQDPTQLCPGPRDTFRVTIYPSLLVVFDPLYVCDGFCTDVVPQIAGGTGNYVGYNWSNGANTPTINVCPTVTTTYFVTVTDDLGCSGVGSVQVEKKLPVTFDLEPDFVEICQDGVDENIEIQTTNVVANGFYGISWVVPSGLDGAPVGNGFTIFDEASIPSEDPYILCATLIDQFGCEGETCMEVQVNLVPIVELLPNPLPACGETTIDLVVDYVPLNFANPAAWFYLYNCEDELIEQIYSNTGPDFTDIDLPVGASEYCFRIVVVDEESGCQNFDELIIPAIQGTEAIVTPNTSICAGNFITMSVLNATSFTSFLWTPGGTGGANYTVSPSVTTQYSVVATDANGCTSEKAILITVNPLPVATISGSLSFCPGGSTTLNASSGGASWLWSNTSNPNLGTTQSLGPINTPDTYTVVVTDANGCTGSASVNVTQDANLNIVVPDLALCDNNPDSLDAGPGFTSYTWRDAGNMVVGMNRKLEVTMAGTYSVSVSDGICSGTTTVDVTNNVTPQLSLDTVEVCRLNTGQGPTNLNFVALQNGVSGQWFNTDLANVDVSDWSNVSFLTVVSRDTFTFTFISDGAVAPCQNITIPLEVVVRNCACPAVAVTPPPALCNSSSGTNSTNLNNLRLHSNPGIWTVIAGPSPAPTINSGILSADGAAPGTHTLRFTLDPAPSGNCPDSSEVDIVIFATPVAITSDTVLCNATGIGPTGINLNTLLQTGSALGGTWIQTSGPAVGGTIPNISTLGMGVGILEFTYTTNTATAPCTDVTVPVSVRVRDCTCPDVVLGRDTLCNGSSTLLDLENPLTFSTDPTGLAGVWTVSNPLTITNNKFFNPLGVPANDYTFTYTLTGNYPANCQKIFDKIVVVRNQTIVDNVGSPCSENTGQGPTTVNLFSLLRSGFTSGGVWTQVSPAAPLLTIPANGIVNFDGRAPGDQFIFRYTVNASLPCTPVDVIVNVRDCNCPPIIINPAPVLCNNGGVTNGMVDLNSLLDAQTGAGVWTVTFQGNPVTITGNVLDVNGLASGNYRCTYTLVPVPGGTCEKFKEIIVRVEDYISVLIMDGEVCNAAVGGNSTNLNLLSLISGTVPLNGQWLDPNRNPIIGVPVVNFNGITPGFLMYYYAINNVDPCTDLEIPVQIEVKDCNCPPFTLINPIDVCNNAGSLDLKTLETVVPVPGSWSVENSSGNIIPITGTVLNLNGLPAGEYTLIYTDANPAPGCPANKSVKLDVFAPKNAGVGSTASFCAGVTDLVSLTNQLSGQDPGGVWTSTQTTGFNATAGTFNLSNIPAGLYTFTYSFSNQAPCPNTSSDVFVRVNEIPVADAGPDKNIDCVIRTIEIGGNSTTGSTIIYKWTLNNDSINNTRTITASSGGVYTLEVTNTQTGCKAADDVRVIQSDDLPTFDIDSSNVRCFGEKNGFIEIINLTGGTPPYQYSFDGGATFGSSDRLNNIGPGSYEVQVKESNGCVNEVVIQITEPALLGVELGPDVRINLGDSVKVEILSIVPDRVTRIVWTANGDTIFAGQNLTSFIAKPKVETLYTVTIFDKNGCSATADIKVSIIKVRVLEIPNIIFTESQNNNQIFVVQSEDLDRILKFRIYDRWGSLVYTADNIDPVNEVDRFWKGTFNNKPVEQGVYVYVIDVLFKDGFFETRAGDVTVIREKN
ncbi:MAG: gliding motility-associated C-terminal domain-containing protein [Saprospiraceae bacterium]|nr:gliding motility-associated C-terminal domain-containing protein [Saprospiraceae bacterium]